MQLKYTQEIFKNPDGSYCIHSEVRDVLDRIVSTGKSGSKQAGAVLTTEDQMTKEVEAKKLAASKEYDAQIAKYNAEYAAKKETARQELLKANISEATINFLIK